MVEEVKFLLRALFGVMDFAVGSFCFWGILLTANKFDGLGNQVIILSVLLTGLSLWTSVYLVAVGHRLLAKLRAAVYGLLILAFVGDWLRLVLSGSEPLRADVENIAIYAVALFVFGLVSSLAWIVLDKRDPVPRAHLQQPK